MVNDQYPGTLLADGFDAAAIGVLIRPGMPPTMVYDARWMVGILMEPGGMDYEEAEEYLAFNTWGAHIGLGTPLYVEVRNTAMHAMDFEP